MRKLITAASRLGRGLPRRQLRARSAMLSASEQPAPRAVGGDARDLLRVRCDGADGAARAAALACLATHGAVVLEGALADADVAAAAAVLQPFLDDVAARWDAEADALPLSWRRWGITRCPRVNAGKKNVHFDPHGARALLRGLTRPARLWSICDGCSSRGALLRLMRFSALTRCAAQAARCTTRWRRWRRPGASRRC